MGIMQKLCSENAYPNSLNLLSVKDQTLNRQKFCASKSNQMITMYNLGIRNEIHEPGHRIDV